MTRKVIFICAILIVYCCTFLLIRNVNKTLFRFLNLSENSEQKKGNSKVYTKDELMQAAASQKDFKYNAVLPLHFRFLNIDSTSAADTGIAKLLLQKKNFYFGAYLGFEDVKQLPPRPSNFLATIRGYFTIYSLPAWYDHVERIAPGQFDFSGPDAVADFAKSQGVKLQAHNLIWHGALPNWLKTANYTPDQLKDILKNHIQTVVHHYREKYPGMVIAWDVVNECMSDSKDLDPKLSYSNGLRKNVPIWNVIHKPGSTDPTDYIQLAFEWAHEADPDAILYWNEFNVEYKGFKVDRWFSIIKSLKEKGLPIGGVGFQSHITLGYTHSASELLENMNRFADIGIQSQITEMDVMMYYKDWSTPPYPHPVGLMPEVADYQRQADLYRNFLSVCLQAKNCNAFIVQGFWDKISWANQKWKNTLGQNEGPFYPGLFDEKLKPKQALTSLISEMQKVLRMNMMK